METIIQEKIEIAAELKLQIQTLEEKQVIVHGIVKASSNQDFTVRAWPTTYLIPTGSDKKYKLLHHYNIVMYPNWQRVSNNATLRFTYIFEGLPADCTAFDLLEIIPEEGPFEARNIQRNADDVYVVHF
jgi:hypothetical protein